MQTSSNQVNRRIVPIYFLLDESGSMDANGGTDGTNRGLEVLHRGIAIDPWVNDNCRISLITFSNIAHEMLPLSHLADVAELPGCTANEMTNYGEAFKLLRVVIARDIANLKSEGLSVIRPVVFFISDGDPKDDWESARLALVDEANPWRPNIFACGYTGANQDVLKKIGTKFFIGEPAVVWEHIVRLICAVAIGRGHEYPFRDWQG